MKRIVAAGVVAALFWMSPMGTAGVARAAEVTAAGEAEVQASAGVTPDSKLYWLERAFERLQMALTQKVEKRAELEARLAVERAAEAAVMAGKGRMELAGKAAGEHTTAMARASAHLQVALEQDRGAKVVGKVAEAQKQSLATLARVLEKAPDQARPALEAALARQTEQVERLQTLHVARALVLEARSEWQDARKNGSAQAVAEAEARLQVAENGWKEAKGLEEAVKKGQAELTEQAGKAVDEVLNAMGGGKEKADKSKGKGK